MGNCKSNKAQLNKNKITKEEIFNSIKELNQNKTSEELIKSRKNYIQKKKVQYRIIIKEKNRVNDYLIDTDLSHFVFEIIENYVNQLIVINNTKCILDVLTEYKIENNEFSKVNEDIISSNFNYIREIFYCLFEYDNYVSDSFVHMNFGELSENSSYFSRSLIKDLEEDVSTEEKLNHNEMIRIFKKDNYKEGLVQNKVKSVNKYKDKKSKQKNIKGKKGYDQEGNLLWSINSNMNQNLNSNYAFLSKNIKTKSSKNMKITKINVNPNTQMNYISNNNYKSSKIIVNSMKNKKSMKSKKSIRNEEGKIETSKEIDDILLNNLVILHSENEDKMTNNSFVQLMKLKKISGMNVVQSPKNINYQEKNFYNYDNLSKPVRIRRKNSLSYENSLVKVIKHKVVIDIKRLDEELEKQRQEAFLLKSTISSKKNRSSSKVDLTRVSK